MNKPKPTPSFVLTLPLLCEPYQTTQLDKLFRISCNIYNSLVADRLKALRQMERTKEWKNVQESLCYLYKQKKILGDEELKKLAQPLHTKRNDILARHGFSEYAFQAKVQTWRNHHKRLINTHVAQKIASAAWDKFSAYLFGNGKSVSFVPNTGFLSIEGKTNNTGIIFKDGFIKVGKTKIPVKMPKTESKASSDRYETEALAPRVKYCRIKRVWKNGWQYFVQLILEGEPPAKRDRNGGLLHPMGTGLVGHDIGTQTLAYCSDKDVGLVELCPEARNIDRELRRINRAMDRSRRATNPGMFDSEGRIVPVDRLPAECKVVVRGKERRQWVESKRYKELASRRRTLFQKQKASRIQQHRELANRMLALGDEHYIEQMRFRGLAKKAKEAKKSKTGKNLSRKRFGKSIANKAPALFVNILEAKVTGAGGSFHKIKTWEAKASQYNHLDRTYNKKKLSQRWNAMPDGKRIQRDLYSAFLIQNTNNTLDGFDEALCNEHYDDFCCLHDREIERLKGAKMPSSAGI